MLLIWSHVGGGTAGRRRATTLSAGRFTIVDWDDRLDGWELELELSAQFEGSDWVTLERAAADTGASRAALRNWYRTGQIPSRLADGPHGPQRMVPLALVAARAEASPRPRRTAERPLARHGPPRTLRRRADHREPQRS